MTQPTYHRFAGDWCYRGPAVLKDCEIYVFPISVDEDRLARLCETQINIPSGGELVAKPWKPLFGRPFLLLGITDFPHIASGDRRDSQYGYISEKDVGLFFLVNLYRGDDDLGLHLLNPYLWVDNPAGVIMGREIFGFPKELGRIGYNSRTTEFDLHALVFHTHSPDTEAKQARVLSVIRGGSPRWLDRLFGLTEFVPIAGRGLDLTAEVATQILIEMADGDIDPGRLVVSAFPSVRLAFLKQLRDVEGHDKDRGCYSEIVRSEFELKPFRADKIIPKLLFFRRRLYLRTNHHESVDFMGQLGIGPVTKLRVGFRVKTGLRLTGHHLP